MREFLLGNVLYHAAFFGYESHYAIESRPNDLVIEGDKKNYRRALDEGERLASICDLDALPDQIFRIREELAKADCRYGEVGRLMNDLRLRMHDQLTRRLCLYVEPNRARYYQNASDLGEDLSGGYEDARNDAVETYRCLALGRYTACVFHAMRVLEVGLSKLAIRFDVDFKHTNWHPVIDKIETRIRNMGDDANRATDWRDQQEAFSQCASSLVLLKNAWRNYTVHIRGKYDDQEASEVLGQVKSFMGRLSRLVS